MWCPPPPPFLGLFVPGYVKPVADGGVMLDTGRLNPQYKGCEFRVAPLFDIYDNGKQRGFSLQMKLAGKKRFARKYAFYFETRSEADSACEQLNAWSKEYPECSGNPCSCPENEGYGCCNRSFSPQPSNNVDAIV